MTLGLLVTDLTKSYGNKLVVDAVNLEVLPGEIVGLLGPNGAGKTTAFYMMIGLIKPDSGSVIFNGVDITTMPIHERSRLGLGYLAQEPSVFKDLSVSDNLYTVLEIVEPDAEKIVQQKDALLQEFGLTHCAMRKAGSLSGGERRRLEIARTLSTQPRCVMLKMNHLLTLTPSPSQI